MKRLVIVGVLVSLLVGSCLFVTACNKKSNPMAPAPSADVTITITGINGNMSYSPDPATAKVGQRVVWRNSGGTTHTATEDGGAFDTGNINNGGVSAPITMGTAGSFGYHCTIHPSMVGTLNVTP